MAYPGQQANSAVRTLGIAIIILSAIAAVLIVLAAIDTGPGAEGTGLLVGLAVFLNGLLGGALLVVFGAIGDNLIAIRKATEKANAIDRRIADEQVTADSPPPSSDYQGPRCPKCDFPVKADDAFCTNCGVELD